MSTPAPPAGPTAGDGGRWMSSAPGHYPAQESDQADSTWPADSAWPGEFPGPGGPAEVLDSGAEGGPGEPAPPSRGTASGADSLVRSSGGMAVGTLVSRITGFMRTAVFGYALGTGTLVLVSGGLVPGSSDIGLARRLIADAIAELVPVARDSGVRLGIEALHPVFAADRCVISRLGEALDLAAQFPADAVGVVVDTYHVWWDASLLPDIARAGDRIVSYQVCDWILPLPAGTLLGRGHVGDGHIDFPPITAAVTAAGYAGDIEVEIFNQAIWSAPAAKTAALVRGMF